MTPVGLCQCGCGKKTKIAALTRANRGYVKGQPMKFLKSHFIPETKHGMCSSSEYSSWRNMKVRCADPLSYCGKKGVTVCDRWLNSFDAFLSDMGNKPSGAYIDRINNDGNYEPGNCRWATSKQSANNRANPRTAEIRRRISETNKATKQRLKDLGQSSEKLFCECGKTRIIYGGVRRCPSCWLAKRRAWYRQSRLRVKKVKELIWASC